MQKLVLTQDTSNIENIEISSNELKEKKKKRRRVKTKKNVIIIRLIIKRFSLARE